MHRRSHLDIIKDMLDICLDTPQMKSAIMYKANLSYRQLEEHLQSCERTDLLKKQIQGSRVVYITTKKGMEFIKAFERVQNILQSSTHAHIMVKRNES